MTNRILIFLLLASLTAAAQEPASTEETQARETAAANSASEPNGDGIESPKTMSGMSILGNEEAPKALVIVPWKSSELGNEISLTDSLEARATPIDREVFLRELRFYEIRTGE